MSRPRTHAAPLLALATLTATLGLTAAPTPASAQVAPTSCAGRDVDLVWTGASGDGSWDTGGNWDDGSGGTRVPGSADDVCVDTGSGGAVRATAGIEVRQLEVVGSSTDPAVELSGEVSAELIRNDAVVTLRGARVGALLDNRAGATLRISSVIAEAAADQPSLVNAGLVVVAAPEVGFPGGVSATIEGWVVNGGTIAGSPDARLVLGTGRYSGLGPDRITVPLTVAAGTFAPGPAPFRVPALGWSRQTFELDVSGLAGGSADRVLVAGRAGQPTDGDQGNGPLGSRFRLVPGAGYVPCAGARLQLVTWGQRVVGDPVESHAIDVTGLAPGLRVRLVERYDGLVAEVTGSSSGVACSDTVGDRLVSGWFVDGLGRPARPEQLTWFGARADAADLRQAAARELLLGEAAVGRFADGEFRRILGRPASAAALRTWTARLRQEWSPDRLRAETYGGAAFWARAGATPAAWTRALYRTELGREATAAEVSSSVAEQGRGVSRATIAARLLAGGEADRALAARSVALWWSRPATVTEQDDWSVRYQCDAELTVTADLAAATPVG